MEIRSDIVLKGTIWRKTFEKFQYFWPQSSQPIYNLYALSITIGIMYDQQIDVLDVENDYDQPLNVPRTVLQPHNSDLDFMFQTAILTSKLVNYSDQERLKLAFDTKCDIAFNRFEFLTKFANFGVTKLLEISCDEPVEMMENLKKFMASSVEGYNYEINEIPDEDIELDSLEEEDLEDLINQFSKLQ
ncbi:MAG: hypothetical protein IJB71_01390 [Bacilli bacterium]|nr:hypothetical protein [Bacilli bacterium]